MSSNLSSKSILLTGANGFTGRFVCLELQRRGIPFIANLRTPKNSEWMKERNIPCRYSDLNKIESLSKALEGCESLLNVASIGFGAAPKIIEASTRNNVNRVIFVSTTSIFTHLNPDSKLIRIQAENVIKESNLNWTILRPTMIYGTPYDRNIIRLIKWIDSFPFLPVFGNGRSLQQPVHVSDVAWAIVRSINEKKTFKRSFNISGATSLSFNKIIELTANELERNPKKLHLPSRLFASIFHKLESFGFRMPIKAEQIQRLNEDKAFSHNEAYKAFGYNPMSFQKGINKAIKLYREKSDGLTQ